MVQLITLSLPTWVEVELGCDNTAVCCDILCPGPPGVISGQKGVKYYRVVCSGVVTESISEVLVACKRVFLI